MRDCTVMLDNEVIIDQGRVYEGVNETVTREAFQEIQAGRRCGICKEPQLDKAWPKQCSLCQRDFRRCYDQFMRRFQGEEWVGSRIDERAEIDRLDAELEEDNWNEHPTTGIVIPRGAKL